MKTTPGRHRQPPTTTPRRKPWTKTQRPKKETRTQNMGGGLHENMEAWTAEEDALLHACVEKHGTHWSNVRTCFDNRRSVSSIRNRWGRIQKGLSAEGRNKCTRCGMIKKGHTCKSNLLLTDTLRKEHKKRMRMYRKDKKNVIPPVMQSNVSETTEPELFLPLEEPEPPPPTLPEITLPEITLPCVHSYFQTIPSLFLDSPTPSEQTWRLKVAADLGFPLDLTPPCV